MYDTFQDAVDSYFDQLRAVTTVAELIAVTNDVFAAEKQFSTADAFYPGPDDRFHRALAAKWKLAPASSEGRFAAIDSGGCPVMFDHGDLCIGEQPRRCRPVTFARGHHAATGSDRRERWEHTA